MPVREATAEEIEAFEKLLPQSFEDLKTIICGTHEINTMEGTYKDHMKSRIVTGIFDKFPKWLEDKFLEILSILSKKGATRHFFELIKNFLNRNGTEKLIKLLPLENGTFLNECVNILLCALCECWQPELVRYLLLEKHVSPNIRVHKQFTPLILFIHARKDLETKLKMIELFHLLHADFNATDAYGKTALIYSLEYRYTSPLEIKQLLEKGSTPFLFNIWVSMGWSAPPLYMNTLDFILERKMNILPLLFSYGAGLMCFDQRPKKFKSRDNVDWVNRMIHDEFNKLGDELRKSKEIVLSNADFKEKFFNAPIIFRCQLEDSPQWIFSLEEFAKLLDPKTKMCDSQREILDVVCHSVLMAPKDYIEPRVVELFKEYLKNKKEKHMLLRYELSKYLKHDEPSIIESYLVTGFEKSLMKKFT